MTIKNPTGAWEDCPRANACSVNRCILGVYHLKISPLDSEQKCTLPKSIRVRIAKKWKLRNGGLRDRERIAMKMWAELPQSEKDKRISKLKDLSPVTRLLARGCQVIPPKKGYVSNPHTKTDLSSERAISQPINGLKTGVCGE